MAVKFQTLVFFLSLVVVFFFSAQASPQNIEVFYPLTSPSSPPPLLPPPSPSPEPNISANPPPSPSNDDTNSTIAKAVGATAASTIVIAGVLLFLIRKYVVGRGKISEERVGNCDEPRIRPDSNEFGRVVNGNIKGLFVDENGLDVVYWKQLQTPDPVDEELGIPNNKVAEAVHEIPLLRGKSSTSHLPPPVDDDESAQSFSPLSDQRKAPPSLPLLSVQINKSPPPPPPVPAPVKTPAPPPPPATAPPKAGGSVLSLKPPPAPTDKSGTATENGDNNNNKMKLKPLHWDKVNKKADQSMVWDKINDGSFKFDGDLMEALFGYVATNRKSPTTSSNSNNTSTSSSSQIMILEARKSQNIAIVLKSLALSRSELIEALNEGQGLEADTLEKLIRIAPTQEEETQILDFDGDPTRLADAESFLFHVLKAIPSAFTRLNAMQFRSNYDSEIPHMKESLQILDFGCKELRSQRLFMKLLEAILKAGNRMNAGTARGNAQAFNLTSLLKLSDVKSTDGKTTLLHFVVEEVVRSEGKKCFISRSHRSSNGSFDHSTTKAEYITLGLPVVGGISAELSNVKKAATIDFNSFSGTCSTLADRVAQIKQLVLRCMGDGKGGFVQEMKGFIDDSEEDLKIIRDEQKRVMDHVKRTAEYYQAGASKDPFKLFVIVKDFLGMVDQVCVEIARDHQQRRKPSTSGTANSTNYYESRTKMRFPILPPNFMSNSNSGNSDVDS